LPDCHASVSQTVAENPASNCRFETAIPRLGLWPLLDQFGRIVQVEVRFKLRAGGAICLPRITQPEPAQALLRHQLGWSLPEQPPPKTYKDQAPDVWTI
jgi:hypothetical protein